ncbi:hypothetical protein GOP47_0023762 [Adiantum capillus-veneris]|uniref:Uncharacterized protein n=1 Tax=Adiantum capillus-veneris TaxID=13818 RepID=A0A9D4U570_ADICA|nr:hypothetical protein GOP47_0023762 [Adiantum capillus-veneris]
MGKERHPGSAIGPVESQPSPIWSRLPGDSLNMRLHEEPHPWRAPVYSSCLIPYSWCSCSNSKPSSAINPRMRDGRDTNATHHLASEATKTTSILAIQKDVWSILTTNLHNESGFEKYEVMRQDESNSNQQ